MAGQNLLNPNSGKEVQWRGPPSQSLGSAHFVLPALLEGAPSSRSSDADDVESQVGSDSAHVGGVADTLTHLLRSARTGWVFIRSPYSTSGTLCLSKTAP